MSNISGKAYAMNVLTPIKRRRTWINKTIFWLAKTRGFQSQLRGLVTLSLIHYARWAIVRPSEFPRLAPEQPAEDLEYTYMFFFSNFNGSWDQYVDSFSSAIPTGLDLLWFKNLKWPKSIPMLPFHAYITSNQVWTNYYYNSYPMAASNDIKSAQRVQQHLREFVPAMAGKSPEEFKAAYGELMRELQEDLNQMYPTPIVSLASAAVEQRGQEADAYAKTVALEAR